MTTDNYRVILTCTCPGQKAFARSAFQTLFKGEPMPEVLSGDGDLDALIARWDKTNFGEYVKALKRTKAKFCYLFTVAPDGRVLEQFNLTSGARVC